ncbi:LysR family transcriptional regulator [uncultured Cytophaga sp.]|uniref:winged helix-turn-helix domain-containing protein n=1 Tax=uncultured Cytophaga sp. TaxID=160238 RepID=UPI0026079D51|nr:LysR family transcriptional regulator [uncultured Cytophaga sp.]
MPKSEKKFIIRGRIWIDSDDGPFLGAGRIELLKSIIKEGSITKAAKSMKMAYRQAWHLIESMNSKGKEPLVLSVIGGKGGGGATVTDYGVTCIEAFENAEAAFAVFVKMESDKLGI